MSMLVWLRGAAVAIVAAALVDPACTATRVQRPRLGILVAESPTFDLPSSSSVWASRRDEALRVQARLVEALSAVADVDTNAMSDQQALVVIGDRLPVDLAVRPGVAVTTIDVGGGLSPNVAADSVDTPPTVRVGTRVAIGVRLSGAGVAGVTSTVHLQSGAMRLGSQTHTWQADESQVVLAFDLVAWRPGPLPLRAEIVHQGPEVTTTDNVVDAATFAEEAPARVLVLDARPSWASRFVAHALERDPGCVVTVRTSLGRGTQAASQGPPAFALTDALMDSYEVVVVSSLDGEDAAVVEWLDAFMRIRGGAVVALADDVTDLVAIRRWWPLDVRPETQASPVKVTSTSRPGLTWRATEFAIPRHLEPTADVLAFTAGPSPRPVVVTHAVGLGRLVANTALDAWRFRGDDDSRFSEFWRGVIVGLAMDAVSPVAMAVDASAARPGDPVAVRVSLRQAPQPGDRLAQVGIEGSGTVSTVWPSGREGAFDGITTLPSRDGNYTISVTAGPDVARAAVRVGADVRPSGVAPLPLGWLAHAHGGTAADSASLDALIPRLRRQLEDVGRMETVATRPMRSAWWMVPFAGLLGLEWVLRRRRGER